MKQKIIDTINDHELQAIKKFIYNDEIQDTLAHINDNVMDFNILEITGMGHYEIRHSNILGWLFDDSEHNLEYKILENFLKKVIEANKYTDDTKEKDILDKLQSYIYLAEKKKDITIYREKDNIDLLIVDEANRVVITIENKIFSKERTSGETDDGQLSKYENIIKEKFKNDYEKYFIFLTLNLDEPIKGKEYWMQASYQMIADVIENILSVKQELSVKTRLVLDSYVDLLKRRGIVASKELEELTNKIWSNPDYKKALEILYQYKPDMQLIISKYLQDKLEELQKQPNLNIKKEVSSKAFIRFTDQSFDNLPGQKDGKGWHAEIDKILVYEFNNLANSLSLDLIVGPGDPASRKNFFNIDICGYKKKLVNFDKDKKSWPRILKILIKPDDIDEFNESAIKERLDKFLDNFFSHEGEGCTFFKIREQVLTAFKQDEKEQ